MRVDSKTLRKLIPAAAVGIVLAVSYFAQVTTLAAMNDFGYGYANNCGVKGDGFHDHGKPCPNRPFPGKGIGVMRILGETLVSPSGHGKSATAPTVLVSLDGSGNSNASHGHGQGRGHSKHQ